MFQPPEPTKIAVPSTPPNIYIIGAQSTGKTTITTRLRDHFLHQNPGSLPRGATGPPAIISEVARGVLAQHNLTAEDVRSPERSLNLQRLILQAQARAEQAALQQAAWFISDRSGVDPVVYALRYVGAAAAAELTGSAESAELKARMSTSVVVVCEAGMDWLRDDGVRLMPEDVDDWMCFHQMFCDFLNQAGLRFFVLPASLSDSEARMQWVLARWEELANRQTDSA